MDPFGSDPNLPHRQRMVDEQIRSRGVYDLRVLEAMEQVPRERFVPASMADQAFSDRALCIDCGQTISQPFMVASMTASLQVQPEHRVLEIGTGSGYQSAILARLARQVYTVERLQPLQAAAQSLLESLGVHNMSYRVGDGSLGWLEEAPFDRILVTAAAPEVPTSLVNQLVDGGRMVIPVGGGSEQTLTVVEHIGGRTRELPQFACRFVKLVGREAWADDQAIDPS